MYFELISTDTVKCKNANDAMESINSFIKWNKAKVFIDRESRNEKGLYKIQVKLRNGNFIQFDYYINSRFMDIHELIPINPYTNQPISIK